MPENLYIDGKVLRNKGNYDKIRWNCPKCNRKECICDAEVCTEWSKLLNLNGVKSIEFNHIAKGYFDREIKPKPVNDAQKKMWKGARWHKKKVYLKDGRIIDSNE